jgi:glutamate dehydrogenase (NAD(P)+)
MGSDTLIWRDHEINGETFALVVQTRHGGSVATTAVHRQDFPRCIGGVRCVLPAAGGGAADGLAEVGHLSSTMTEKCMAAMIAADGQKSVVVTTPEVMDDHARKVALLVEHQRIVAGLDAGVIFGPDMAVPEPVQDAIAAHPDLLDHVSGLSSRCRGLSIDENGYTALGVAEAIRTVHSSVEGRTVSVQGFGAVGAHTARLLAAAGARVVAVSNALGTLLAADGASLDVEAMFTAWQAARSDAWIGRHTAPGVRFDRDPGRLLRAPVEIFVPAARTSVLATAEELEEVRRTENPHATDVAAFLEHTGVRLVAQGANHPLSGPAEEYLERNGAMMLPDYIVNCGGLIGCWVEWEARHTGFTGDLVEVAEQARTRIRDTVRGNITELLRTRASARTAAAEIVHRNRENLLRSAKMNTRNKKPPP